MRCVISTSVQVILANTVEKQSDTEPSILFKNGSLITCFKSKPELGERGALLLKKSRFQVHGGCLGILRQLINSVKQNICTLDLSKVQFTIVQHC